MNPLTLHWNPTKSRFETKGHDYNRDYQRVKDARFRWDSGLKIWWTDNVDFALKLVEFATGEAMSMLSGEKQTQDEAYDASRATDADIEIPAPEGQRYYPFQRGGISAMLNRKTNLLADEMGLGKTIQVIGLINLLGLKRVLIGCPASLRLNWAIEMLKWLTGDHRITVLTASMPKRDIQRWAARGVTVTKQFPMNPGIVIVNYDIIDRYYAELRLQEWELAAFDECHYLRNPKTKRTLNVFGGAGPKKKNSDGVAVSEKYDRIPWDRLILLTGTPIVNRPKELFPLLNAIDSQRWSNFFTFARRYCNASQGSYGWDFSGSSNLDELNAILRRTCMVRRLKKDVLTELPDKLRQVLAIPANGLSKFVDAEQEIETKSERAIEDARLLVALAAASDDKADYEAAVKKLQQASGVAFAEMARVRHETALAKVSYVVAHAEEALETETKIGIFAHHRDVMDEIAEGLKSYGVVRIDGSVAMAHRTDVVERFQTDPKVRVFVGQIQAAGVGITLTAASHAIFAELDWVPGNMTQAEDRFHRIGQDESVLIQHIVLDGSLDHRMATTLIKKQAVADQALDKRVDLTEVDEAAKPIDADHIEEVVDSLNEKAKRDRTASYDEITKIAEKLSAAQVDMIHLALQMLAGSDEDRARVINDVGFSKFDVEIGHSLAEKPRLSKRQGALGWRLIRKYRRQMPDPVLDGLGIKRGKQ